MLPDELRISIDGPTACDVTVTDGNGGPLPWVTAIAVTYRAQEIGTVTVESVDIDGPVVDGELPIHTRTYELFTATPRRYTGAAVIESAVA